MGKRRATHERAGKRQMETKVNVYIIVRDFKLRICGPWLIGCDCVLEVKLVCSYRRPENSRIKVPILRGFRF